MVNEKKHNYFKNKIANLRKGESTESLRNEMDSYYESQGVNVNGLKQEIKNFKCGNCYNENINYPRIKLDDAYEKKHSYFKNKIANLRKGESTESLRNEMNSYYESQGVNVDGLKQEIKETGKQWARLTPKAQKILRQQKGIIGYWMYNVRENCRRHEIDYESEEHKILLKLSEKEDIQNLKSELLQKIKVYKNSIPKKKRIQERMMQLEKLESRVESLNSTLELYGYKEFVDSLMNNPITQIYIENNPSLLESYDTLPITPSCRC